MVEVVGPLGDDQLIFRRMRGREALGRLFEYNVELFSDNPGLKLTDVLGQGMAVRLTRSDGQQRFFNGDVTEFHRGGSAGRYYALRRHPAPLAVVSQPRRRLPHLPGQERARHHQGNAARARARRDRGRDVRRLPHARRTACSTARPTFNFISRLMEEEGIYYYFQHAATSTRWCSPTRCPRTSSRPATRPCRSRAARARPSRIASSSSPGLVRSACCPGVLPDRLRLREAERRSAGALDAAQDHAGTGFEQFDFPGALRDTATARATRATRMEEQQAQYEPAGRPATLRGLGPATCSR